MSFFKKRKIQKITLFAAAFLATGSLWAVSTLPVAASANQLYLSPASVSVQQSDSFSVTLRVNPAASIDTVTASISFDPSKLTLQGVDCSGSPLTAFPSCPSGGNPVNITSYIPGGSVSSDSFVAKLTFKAVAGSGSSTLGLSGDTASGGNSQGASTANAIVSFTTPTVPTCAAGQTGTYPNCVTPPSGSGSGSGGGSSGGGSHPSGGSSSAPKSGGSSGAAPTTAPSTPATVGSGTATVSAKDVKFTQAMFTATSKDPTQVYVQFGTNKNSLTEKTSLSELGTTHTITIDPHLLTPGQTYYYVVVSKNQAGVITQTNLDSFTLNGLTVRVGVFDKNNKPIIGKQVTLHSTPMTATTDAKGFASFSNVIPGMHQVLYANGSKTYTQQISVDNNVTTTGDRQTAPVQTVSVVYSLTASKSIASPARVVILGLLVVVVAVAAVVYSKRKLRFAAPSGAPLSVAPIVVGGKSGPSVSRPVTSTGEASTTTKAIETNERLNSIVAPNKPLPGSTVAPIAPERKQF